jgi:hypothetical protein
MRRDHAADKEARGEQEMKPTREQVDYVTTAPQVFMSGHRIASRVMVPECREKMQAFLDAHDFVGLRAWLRPPFPGEPPWPEPGDVVALIEMLWRNRR